MMIQNNGGTKCFICFREKPLYMPALFEKERHSQQLESNRLGATWRSWIYSD